VKVGALNKIMRCELDDELLHTIFTTNGNSVYRIIAMPKQNLRGCGNAYRHNFN
jgi:hypothetical protein